MSKIKKKIKTEKAAHDNNLLALSGLFSYTGNSTPTNFGCQIVDLTAGFVFPLLLKSKT